MLRVQIYSILVNVRGFYRYKLNLLGLFLHSNKYTYSVNVLGYRENNATNKLWGVRTTTQYRHTISTERCEKIHLLTMGYYFKAYVHNFTENVNSIEHNSTVQSSMQSGNSANSIKVEGIASMREKERERETGGYVIRCTIDAAKQHVPQ